MLKRHGLKGSRAKSRFGRIGEQHLDLELRDV
jgi:hypothetical protein